MSCPPLGPPVRPWSRANTLPPPPIKAYQDQESPVPIERCTYQDDSFDGLCIENIGILTVFQSRLLIRH